MLLVSSLPHGLRGAGSQRANEAQKREHATCSQPPHFGLTTSAMQKLFRVITTTSSKQVVKTEYASESKVMTTTCCVGDNEHRGVVVDDDVVDDDDDDEGDDDDDDDEHVHSSSYSIFLLLNSNTIIPDSGVRNTVQGHPILTWGLASSGLNGLHCLSVHVGAESIGHPGPWIQQVATSNIAIASVVAVVLGRLT